MDEEITLKSITEKLESIERSLNNLTPNKTEDRYESSKTEALNTSLALAMKNYKDINLNRKNAYYGDSYSDINQIMSTIRPILAEQELSVTQRTIIAVSGETLLQTRLWHSSGQWIESRCRIIPSKNDLHTYGSALQYNKRYQYMSLLGVTIKNDPIDDDAELDMTNGKERVSLSFGRKYTPKKESNASINKHQIRELEMVFNGEDDDFKDDFLESYRIQNLSDLPESVYEAAITRLREVKNTRKYVS